MTSTEWQGRWNHVKKIVERAGPFSHPEFEPSSEVFEFLQNVCKILVVGAGGLGCELLKNLALMGFRNIDVIDMDTIDVTNLNRQFLFRASDVGKPKAEVATKFISERIPGANFVPHFKKIQDYDEDFYRSFHIVVCGLDSIIARRWLCNMLVSLLNYENGVLDESSIIPMVDGGTEGFKGNCRVIIPGMSACIECTLDLFPPQINFPLCTIAHTPRLPEHCIEFVKVLQWPKSLPFGDDVNIDGDDPAHIQWIFEQASERADQYHIHGVTYRLTQGVVKHIIPAVASTNAVIAAACTTEVLKITTSCYSPLANYMVFNNADSLYSYKFEAEKNERCFMCSQVPQTLTFSQASKFREVLDYLINSTKYQMKSPGISATVNGKNKTLYMQSVESIEKRTRVNLSKTLDELGLVNGQEIIVADVTSPNAIIFELILTDGMES